MRSLIIWVRMISIAIVLLLIVGGLLGPVIASSVRPNLPTAVMFIFQDLPIAVVMLVLLLMFRPGQGSIGWRVPSWWPLGLALILILFCWWGHYAVLSAYDLSRDEKMASFDSAIFAGGHLFAPVSPAWRHFLPALNALYILPIAGNAAWVSDYLPGNAALRALIGLAGDRSLTSPLLVGAGLIALHRIAFRLWPQSTGSRVTAMICYAGSSQVLLAGMTSYAMSAHLTFDLVWLALFLRRDAVGMTGAIVVGFIATGLHQPLFHALFVLPFLLVERRRDRRAVAIYLVAYAAIGCFWLAWPHWIAHLAGSAPLAHGSARIGFFDRFLSILAGFTLQGLWLMALNLLRFVTWQHPLLLPLALAGSVLARSQEPIVEALIDSILLPLPIVMILAPDPHFGWGYRYLHGAIGSACLLAGYGWQKLEAGGTPVARALVVTTVIDLVLLIPAHCLMAHRMTAPARQLDDQVRRTNADMVIMDSAAYSDDVVINAPDLSNRPVRLLGWALGPADIAALCRRGSIAFADGPALARFAHEEGQGPLYRTSDHQKALKAAANRFGCNVGAFPQD